MAFSAYLILLFLLAESYFFNPNLKGLVTTIDNYKWGGIKKNTIFRIWLQRPHIVLFLPFSEEAFFFLKQKLCQYHRSDCIIIQQALILTKFQPARNNRSKAVKYF